MKKFAKIIRLLSLLLCLALIAAANWTAVAAEALSTEAAETKEVVLPREGEGTEENPYLIGEGETSFWFTVQNLDGKLTHYVVSTSETVVGEALQRLSLIEGEEGPYGLYVKAVGGVKLDYDTDGHYWAFYVNGEYGMTGVDVTNIEPDVVYAFRAE